MKNSKAIGKTPANVSIPTRPVRMAKMPSFVSVPTPTVVPKAVANPAASNARSSGIGTPVGSSVQEPAKTGSQRWRGSSNVRSAPTCNCGGVGK